MMPKQREVAALTVKILALLPVDGGSVTETALEQAFEASHGSSLRGEAHTCGFGNTREMLETLKEVKVKRTGPSVAYHLTEAGVQLRPKTPQPKPAPPTPTPTPPPATAKPTPAPPTSSTPALSPVAEPKGETSLEALLASLAPSLGPETFVFARIPKRKDVEIDVSPVFAAAVMLFKEEGGLTVVLPIAKRDLLPLGSESCFPCRRITLTVQSSLTAVGLTAAVSNLLALHEIPCNVVAAYHHDHIFVPESNAKQTMNLLSALKVQSELPNAKRRRTE